MTTRELLLAANAAKSAMADASTETKNAALRAMADALEGRVRTVSLGDTIKLKGKKDGFEILTLEEIL